MGAKCTKEQSKKLSSHSSNLEKKLKKLFTDILSINTNDIKLETSKESLDEWDSFNHLLLISEIEKYFKIKFSVTEIEEIKTFKDLLKLVNTKSSK